MPDTEIHAKGTLGKYKARISKLEAATREYFDAEKAITAAAVKPFANQGRLNLLRKRRDEARNKLELLVGEEAT